MVNLFGVPFAGLTQLVSASASTKEELLAFTADPPSLTSGATRRRRRLWRGTQVTVAPAIERGELGSEEETDYATTE